MKKPEFPQDRIENTGGCFPQLAAVLILLILIGCGAKKKHVEKYEASAKVEKLVVEKYETTEQKDVQIVETKNEQKEKVVEKQQEAQEVKSDYYKKTDPDGTVYEYKNYSNKTDKSKSNKKDTQKIDSNKLSTDKSKKDAESDVKSDIKEDNKVKQATLDVDKKQFDIMTALMQAVPYILVIALIIFLYYKFNVRNFIKNLFKSNG